MHVIYDCNFKNALRELPGQEPPPVSSRNDNTSASDTTTRGRIILIFVAKLRTLGSCQLARLSWPFMERVCNAIDLLVVWTKPRFLLAS